MLQNTLTHSLNQSFTHSLIHSTLFLCKVDTGGCEEEVDDEDNDDDVDDDEDGDNTREYEELFLIFSS